MPEERISPAVIIIPVALGLAAVAVIGMAAMAQAPGVGEPSVVCTPKNVTKGNLVKITISNFEPNAIVNIYVQAVFWDTVLTDNTGYREQSIPTTYMEKGGPYLVVAEDDYAHSASDTFTVV